MRLLLLATTTYAAKQATQAPRAPGAASLTLYFMSDCYLGVDLQYEFTLEVRPSE